MIYSRLFPLLTAILCAASAFAATDLPLVQDFELSSGGFIPSSTTSWKWGPPVVGPGEARSGTQVWGTNLTSSTYSNSEDAALISPKYDLSHAAGKWIVVHWWQYLVTEYAFDVGLVEVSKDGGGTWETVFGPRSGEVAATWTQQTVVLAPSYATDSFQIRFRLISDDVPSQGGFFIDDLRVAAAEFTEAMPVLDFEIDNGGFVAAGVNSSWAYGTPVSAPGSAYSGLNAWATNLNGLYNANEDSTLTSPAFDLSGSAGKLLVLSWWQYFDTEASYDFATVEISKDDGATWSAVTGEAPASGEVSVADWMRRQAFIDSSYATAGFRFRFRLSSDETYQFDGVAIDDVAVYATSELFPSTSSFTKSAPQNVPINFQRSDFTSRYADPDGGVLTAITVLQLPSNGTLKLGADAVSIGQTIAATNLSSLRYEPLLDASGVETFTWTANNFFGPSTPATVSLNTLAPTPEIAITTEPDSQTVNPGTTVTFSVVAVSSLPLTYQWRKNQAAINGANGASFTIGSAAEAAEDDYDVVIGNGVDSATSAVATLSVNDPVTFTLQPSETSVNEGESITLAVQAAGTGRLDYQWLKDGDVIPDATFSSFTIVDATEEDGANYQCVVTNIVGPKTTDPAVLTVRLKPRVELQPLSNSKTVSRRIKLKVTAEGTGPFTYQWLKDGEEIPGATRPNLLLKKLRTTSEGSYTVRVGNGAAETESEAVELQIFRRVESIGTYEDVIEHQEPVSDDETPFPGRLKVSVTRGGTFSAQLEYRGETYRFKGLFNAALTAERKISRPGHSPLEISLSLDPSTLSLSASVTHDESGVTYRGDGVLPLHRFHAKKNPAPQEGRYTVLLQSPSGSGGSDAPAYLTAKVSKSGQMRLKGKMPDGSVFSGGALVHFTSRAAIYENLQSKKLSRGGELAGRVTLPSTAAEAEAGGELAWRKMTTAAQPDPVVAPLEAIGSRYVAPQNKETVIAPPQDKGLLELQIAGSITLGEIQRWIRLSPGNRFAAEPASTEKIRFRLIPSDGRVIGSYTDPTTKKRHRLEGVALQAQGQIAGALLDSTAPGAFTLAPLQQ